jgi:hypothetical protein
MMLLLPPSLPVQSLLNVASGVVRGLVVNSGRNFRFPERNQYIPALGAGKGIPVRNNYFAMRPTAQSGIPVS